MEGCVYNVILDEVVVRRILFIDLFLMFNIKLFMRATHLALALLLLTLVLTDKVSRANSNFAVQHRLKAHRVPKEGQMDADDIYKFVDHALKEKFWYYLTKGCLIYVAAVDQVNAYQFLAVYRNLGGTYLAITTWKNQSSIFNVNTLVRLGNGKARNANPNYKPVNLHVNRFRYSLGEKQYLVDVSDCGKGCGRVKVNGHELSDNLKQNIHHEEYESDKDALLIQRCQAFSDYTREKFWYYLQNAHVVYSSVGSTAERNYCLITYINIAGTFFVIGNEKIQTKACTVNTFVRIDEGCSGSGKDDFKPLIDEPFSLPLKDFEE